MKKLFIILFAVLVGVGCHAQVPPTNHIVTLTWTAPPSNPNWAGCTTSAPCAYILSRISLNAGTTTCPAPNLTTPNYTPLNQSTPTSALTYTDNSAAGLTACYIVQTQQGTAISAPSNTTLVVVPANPLAPALQTPVVAQLKQQKLLEPTELEYVAHAEPISLYARAK